MSEVFGDEPRPWVLAYGFDADSELGQAVGREAGKVTYLSSQRNINFQVRQSDYDAFVVLGASPSIDGHLRVLQFGGPGFHGNEQREDLSHYTAKSKAGVAGRLLGPDATVPEEASELSRRSLAPFLYTQSPRTLVFRNTASDSGDWVRDDEGIAAFVREQGGFPCAGIWLRPQGMPWWWLPRDAPDNSQWVTAAFAQWRREDRVRFPSGPDWANEDPWRTTAEVAVAKELADHLRREAEVLAELAATRAQLVAAREAARAAADAAERRLLTAQGDELVDEVKSALEEIGFEVIESDKLRSNASEKLEDLRVSAGSWLAVAEVKGYGGRRTAKTGDLLQVGRAATRYAAAEGRIPDAQWYIVNQQAGSSPARRPRPLSSNPGDVQDFASGGGLVIDTADLFRIREAVRQGVMTAEAALSLLQKSTGVLTYV
ncbi:hypothetical protein GCE86_19285 [Micromonospora terminaliae]|uniref:Uncharacterized protein n=1 Tax=Micromonospora terminaliae TaxID=1914461 RepID=A0AAJ2ZHI1_9ACTN|nr:hypothetical protein [Micromonospora terminaliae]NES29024.1 hypothetical protein [Micromonospora terminaliae]QGL48967.1 hypothetical protein GCE86_19285 [Micromonospora terminaliae]